MLKNLAGQAECSALSLYVYKDKDQPEIPKGYKFLFDSDMHNLTYSGKYSGFYAAAFFNEQLYEEYKIPEVIIAFRGTCSVLDLMEDYLIALGTVPDYFWEGALPFNNKVVDYIDKNYGKYGKVNFTGHSLGAALAELSVCEMVHRNANCSAIPFDSPGIKPIVQEMINRKQLPEDTIEQACTQIDSQLSDVNAINTCNEHIPLNLFQCFIPYVYDNLPGMPERSYYFKEFTVSNQHKMLGFYKYWNHLQSNKKQERLKIETKDMPVGFENGYLYYLIYNKHPDYKKGGWYWEQYIKSFWDAHPECHSSYDNDLQKFHDFFKSHFLKEKQQALEHQNQELVLRSPALFETDLERLRILVYFGDTDKASELIQKKNNLDINQNDNLQLNTLLHLAVLRDFLPIAKLLIQYKADLDKVNIAGNTPLHLVALNSDRQDTLEWVALLVEAGANTETTNKEGKTALQIVQKKNPTLAKAFENALSLGFVYVSKEEIIQDEQANNQKSQCCMM